MARLTFEDIETGIVARSAPTVLTREAIVAFAQIYDPQPFHLDEAAGAASLLGGLAASGWQTTALGMRLLYDGWLSNVAGMGAPGVDEVRWLRPVRPGDALTLEVEVMGKRESGSRPDRGFLTLALTLRNGAGETVMTQRGPMIVARRGATPSAPAAPAPATPVGPVATAPREPELMLTAFYPELSVGLHTTLGTQRFTDDLIRAFAVLYDPQPFHVDEEAARASAFGGLICSGWQTAAFWMRHYIAARTRSSEARVAAGLAAAVGGPSPGFTNLRWLRPVRAGDDITYGLRISSLRRAGRSNWGIVVTENTGLAADGTLVFAFEGRMLWPIAP